MVPSSAFISSNANVMRPPSTPSWDTSCKLRASKTVVQRPPPPGVARRSCRQFGQIVPPVAAVAFPPPFDLVLPMNKPANAPVTAALLVIGDEILSGRTKDKNIGFIAEYLTALGIDLKEVRVVPD